MSSAAVQTQDIDRRSVLITGGGPPRAAAVASALREVGARPVVIDDLPRGFGVGGLSFDAYLQLPSPTSATDGGPGRGERVLTEALTGRFRAATTVLPWLCPAARVVLVSAPIAGLDAPEDATDRLALMRVLGQALCAEHAPHRISVDVRDDSSSPAELAAAALRPVGRPVAPSEPADDSPAGYADWRTEVLGLIAPTAGQLR